MTTTTDNKRARGFGPKPRPLKELKLKIVPVRFNAANLAMLDQLRGDIPRAVWLHQAGLQQSPPIPAPQFPKINREVWAELARGPMSNMHQVVYMANRAEMAEPDAGWKVIAQHYSELITLAHSIRAGLLSVMKSGERN